MAPYTPVLIRTLCLYHAHTYPFSHVSLLLRTLKGLERHWLFLSCWTNRSFSCSHDRHGTGHRADTLTCKPSGKSAVHQRLPYHRPALCLSVLLLGDQDMDGYVLPALRCSTFCLLWLRSPITSYFYCLSSKWTTQLKGPLLSFLPWSC